MNILEIMQQNQSYCSNHRDMPSQLQQKAKQLSAKGKAALLGV